MALKIAVLGNTGCLGSMVEYYLEDQGHEVVGFNREQLSLDIEDGKPVRGVLTDAGLGEGFDYVINCIGAIKPMFKESSRFEPRQMGKIPNNVYVNSIFPWLLTNYCNNLGWKSAAEERTYRLIHITTDCVFDGEVGRYTEDSDHNPLDAYGKSKSLGEPYGCMVLRTSIIGPEQKGRSRSLVEWLRKNKNKTVSGYTNHYWNGLTTLELAKCIHKIINEGLHGRGTYHLFSDVVSKFDMLETMSNIWGWNIKVKPDSTHPPCTRTLRTVKRLNDVLDPKGFTGMIKELKEFV